MKYLVCRSGRCGRIPTVTTYTRKGDLYEIFAEACEPQWYDIATGVKIFDSNGKLVAEA